MKAVALSDFDTSRFLPFECTKSIEPADITRVEIIFEKRVQMEPGKCRTHFHEM